MSKRIDRQDLGSASTSSPLLTHPDPTTKQDPLPPAGQRNKRRLSGNLPLAMSGQGLQGTSGSMGGEPSMMDTSSMGPPAKKSRTNTPWTPAEEQRLKNMRDAGNTWAEIAKVGFLKPCYTR